MLPKQGIKLKSEVLEGATSKDVAGKPKDECRDDQGDDFYNQLSVSEGTGEEIEVSNRVTK